MFKFDGEENQTPMEGGETTEENAGGADMGEAGGENA